MRTLRALIFLICGAMPAVKNSRAAPPDTFDAIRPVLASCLGCHNERSRASGLSVASWDALREGGARAGPAVIPGRPEESPLIRFLDGSVQPRMPYGKPPLPKESIEALRAWIAKLPVVSTVPAEQGQGWWAFQPIAASRGATIDSLVRQALAKAEISPAGEAPKEMLLRRLYADLLGLPPDPGEASAFLADNLPDAYSKLVDRLLADQRFGERWGRHWLDLARYADTQGFEADRENYYMWRYRDYVIASLNADKPYDQFVREQLAGDELPGANVETRTATGFLRLTPRFQTTNAQESRQMTLDELTGTIGSVFLGLTVRCAQCHDHKYDPIRQRDFYRLQAFLGPLTMVEEPADFAKEAQRRWSDEHRARIEKRIAAEQTEFENYQANLLQRLSLAAPLSQFQDANALDRVFARKTDRAVNELEAKLTRSIANALVPNVEDTTFTVEEKDRYLNLLSKIDGVRGGRDMGTSRREIRRYAPYVHTVRNAKMGADIPMLPMTFIRLNGDINRPGEWVLPGFPEALSGTGLPAELPKDQFGNTRSWRKPLADWIVSPSNPLTARVIVNRIWQHLFGNGLVVTPSDFGKNGARPTHPELLDHLASEFVAGGWSIKATIRSIVLSATYRQNSVVLNDAARKKDPSNSLLWRQNRRRLEGEAIRDSILSASGRLEESKWGPGVFVPLPPELKERMTIKNQPSWTPSSGPEIRKRSIYIFQRRQLEVPFLTVLDAPVFQTSCERRAQSTTPVQALSLLNDPFVTAESQALAERLRNQSSDPREQITLAFRSILSRKPTTQELESTARFLINEPKYGLAEVCRVLFNTNEFAYVD